ncbi:MAG: DUF481 domain-containing protein [Phycisphaerales bacterium]|nr:MAG: DUF481 domain-containing protein [Phycisphaerales bacterium]
MHRWLVIVLTFVCGLSQAILAEEITLTTGEVLQATVVELSMEAVTVDHPVLGRLVIPRDAVRAVDGQPLEPAQVSGVQADESAREVEAGSPQASDAPPAAPAERPEKDKPRWDSQIELGLSATDGNTQDTNLRLAFRTSRKTAWNLFRYDAAQRLATSRGNRTENRFTTGAFSEWSRPDSRWSAFLQGRLDVDEFQSWDERLTLGGGAGYRLLEVQATDEAGDSFDRFILTGRLGGGLRKEYGSLNEAVAPEGLLGAEFAYRISPRQQLAGATMFYPDLGESGDFRVVSSLDWSIDIDHMDGISLKVGLMHEYESLTDESVPHNDIAAHAALVVDF